MIGRRAFTLGLGSLLLPALAWADVRANGKVIPDRKPKKKLLKDIPYTPLDQIPNHRQLMRDIVVELSAYAKKRNPKFVVLARNAPELLIKEKREESWESGRDPDGAALGKYTPRGSVIRPYLKAIDGLVVDGAFHGRDAYGQPTAEAAAKPLLQAAETLRKEGRRVLAIDYCRDRKAVAETAKQAARAKLLSYVDQDGDKLLGRIPPGRPPQENADHVTNLDKVRNFLPMLHSEAYGSRDDWVRALAATNYDLLLTDVFWRGAEPLTAADVKALRYKTLGSQRMVLADLPVGRASDTRFYWQRAWAAGNPSWLFAPDPDDAAQMVVEYWSPEWKAIIGKYMTGIVDLGFDGVVLDGVDAYLPFEDLMPVD